MPGWGFAVLILSIAAFGTSLAMEISKVLSNDVASNLTISLQCPKSRIQFVTINFEERSGVKVRKR